MTTELKAAKVRLEPVTDAQLPPIPDLEIIERHLARSRELKRDTPEYEAFCALPAPREFNAGHYQHLVLDVRSGAFYFHCSDWRTNANERPGYYPGELFAPFMWTRVAPIMYWVLDNGFSAHPYLTAEEGNALAAELAPLAQTMLDHLVQVPGTDELDWSAEAASAGYDIGRAVKRGKLPPLGRRPYLIDMGEAVKALPTLVKPYWADYTDEQLDGEADGLTRFAIHHHPQLADMLHFPKHEESEYVGPRSAVIGTRAWLYGYRLRAAEDRRPVDAASWFASHPVTTITADTTDSELVQAAGREQGAATAEGVQLVGTVGLLRRRRAEMRDQVRAELPPVAARVKADEDALKASRMARHGLLTRVMSWQDPHDDNDAELGRKAGMSRQAVNQLRATFDETE